MNQSSTIFLVDDDQIFLDMLKENLHENPEYNIKAYHSGEECIEHLHLNPDVIVLDYLLNGQNPGAKNGLEIYKRIRSYNPKIKIIILSGQMDANVIYDFVRLNAANYIVKDNEAFKNVKMTIESILV